MEKDRTVKYRRLPGKKSGFYRKCTLYNGEDHFLSVESNIYTEEYYRFYFADIQAFISKRTDRGRIWSIVLGFLALILTTCTINAGAPPAGGGSAVFLGILAAIVIAFLVRSLWLGPTCETWVQTAVTFHALPALGRVKKREKFLAAVRPLIETVQGQVDPSRLQLIQAAEAPVREVPAAPSSSSPPAQTSDLSPSPAPIAAKAGPVHGIMFTVFIFGAGLDVLWVLFPSFGVFVVNILLALVMLTSSVTALVVQAQRVPSISVRRLTWFGMIGFLVIAMCDYVLTIFYMIGSIGFVPGGPPGNPLSFYSTIARDGVTGMPVLAGFILCSAVYFCIVGILGLAGMLNERRAGTMPRPSRVVTGRRSGSPN